MRYGSAGSTDLRAVGGFLPLRLPESSPRSVLSSWVAHDRVAWFTHNGRSALRALWDASKPANVWLPAYVCRELASAVPATVPTRYYPLDDELNPDAQWLARHIAPNDHVVAVDYFGRPAASSFVDLVRLRRDVEWIEDRAHALDTADDAWGDWLLYSPRKLIGVPDGGILVAHARPLPAVELRPLPDVDYMLPSIERLEDTSEVANDRWYGHYVQKEASAPTGPWRMSELSRGLLQHVDLQRDVDSRRRNFAVLARKLRDWAFLHDAEPTYAPMGFPIRVPSAGGLATKLAQHRIFAARHWQHLPSDPSMFPREHRLAQQLLTLPCDYRYDASQMESVAKTVIDGLQSA